jgi:peptide/nickel transport system permease protein
MLLQIQGSDMNKIVAKKIKNEEIDIKKYESISRKAVKRFSHHKLAVTGLVTLGVIMVFSICYPLYNQSIAFDMNFLEVSRPPSFKHLIGTDELGRDVLMRVFLGGRVSLTVGFFAVIFSSIIGIVLGSLAGYFGGKTDMMIMRFTDTVLCFPFLIIAMIFVVIFGQGLFNSIIAIALLQWTSTARITRGEFLYLKKKQFIEADLSLGIKDRKIIFVHLLPNAISPIIVNATFNMANAIMMEASLSFLGLGVSLPTPSWGNMLQDASSLYKLQTMPWLWIPPGIMIALTVLSINFIGDGMRDALDPKMDL